MGRLIFGQWSKKGGDCFNRAAPCLTGLVWEGISNFPTYLERKGEEPRIKWGGGRWETGPIEPVDKRSVKSKRGIRGQFSKFNWVMKDNTPRSLWQWYSQCTPPPSQSYTKGKWNSVVEQPGAEAYLAHTHTSPDRGICVSGVGDLGFGGGFRARRQRCRPVGAVESRHRGSRSNILHPPRRQCTRARCAPPVALPTLSPPFTFASA